MIQALDPLLLETTLLRVPLSSGLHPLWSLCDFLLPCLFLWAHGAPSWGPIPSEPLCSWSRPTSSSLSPRRQKDRWTHGFLSHPPPCWPVAAPRLLFCFHVLCAPTVFPSVSLSTPHASMLPVLGNLFRSHARMLPVLGNLFRFWGASG